MMQQLRWCAVALTLIIPAASLVTAAEPKVQLQSGDHITYVGNTLADRMQHHGWLETYIQALYPELKLTFRDLGFQGTGIGIALDLGQVRSGKFFEQRTWWRIPLVSVELEHPGLWLCRPLV